MVTGSCRLRASSIPDVAVLDLRMPDISGLEVLSELRRSCPDVQVLILTVSNADTDVIAALDGWGVAATCSRIRAPTSWPLSVRQAAEGHMVLAPQIARVLVERVRADAGSTRRRHGRYRYARRGASAGPRRPVPLRRSPHARWRCCA